MLPDCVRTPYVQILFFLYILEAIESEFSCFPETYCKKESVFSFMDMVS
jgi:hypothetical protein